MYDMAKRSLAFTVATGGLLLTGTGYAPADAAVGFGTLPGPAQAQGSAAANQASPTTVSTPISVRGPEMAAPAAPIMPKRDVVTPLSPRSGGSGAAAAASSSVKDSSGILTGNTVQIPIYLGLNLCSNQADAGAVQNTVAGSTCGGSGAAGGSNSGASATATTSHSRGILSGNTIQAPINIPVNACGNQAVAIGAKNSTAGGTCGTGGSSGGSGGGASATAVTDHSGGILSGNIIQAPVNVPVNACGNQVNVIALKDKTGGTTCSLGSGASGPGGSTATAVTDHSGGIGSGITLQTPINVPVNACGDQATVVGFRDHTGGATCTNNGGSSSAISAQMNSGGIVSGWQGGVPINVPVTACGDQAIVGGVKNTTDSPVCIMPSSNSTETGIVENSGGILSGNQASVPINVPVPVCGDAVDAGVENTAGTPECATPPPTSPPPTTPPPTTPPPSSPPPRTPPPTTPPPTTPPSATPPPTSTTPPTGQPSTTPPHGPGTTPPGGGHGPGSLAHTGGEEGVALALGAGALLTGVGMRVASKRRSGKRQA